MARTRWILSLGNEAAPVDVPTRKAGVAQARDLANSTHGGVASETKDSDGGLVLTIIRCVDGQEYVVGPVVDEPLMDW